MKIRNEGRAALEFALCAALLFAATALPSCGHDHVPPVPPSPPPLPPPAPNPPPVDDVSAALLELHNAERAKKSLPPLRIDPKLTTAAVAHSRHMAQVGKLAHFGINDGDPWSRMKDVGYSFSSASENVAWNTPDPAETVRAWMSSAGHRANILGQYQDVGFGMAKGIRGDPYWTTDFGTPARAGVAAELPTARTLPPTAAPKGTKAPPGSPEALTSPGPGAAP
jgi:uncharacterized protein YkwD